MLGPRVPELRALEMLTAIAETGSIVLAAAELEVTQQAISARLQRLEGLLGMKLVVRRAHGSTLTNEGSALVEIARGVLSAAADLENEIELLRSQEAGTLKVAASLTVAEYLLPHWIAQLREETRSTGQSSHDVSLVATNTQRVAHMVRSGEAELGFVEGAKAPLGLRYRYLLRDELMLIVGPTHPWARRPHRSATPEEVALAPLVAREWGSGCRAVLQAALKNAGVPSHLIREPALELPGNVAITEILTHGTEAAAITVHAVRSLVDAGRLVQIRTPGLDLTRRLGAVWRDGKEPRSLVARQLLAQAARTRDSVSDP